jgi:membrane complex biogenesis BtpA family protein
VGDLLPGRTKVVLGMVHLRPLPGTPFYEDESFPRILDEAVLSARALYEGGAAGCLVQTVDRVYRVDDDSDPARTVAMGLIVRAIVEATDAEFHIGVQLMHNAVKSSLAVAKVAGGSFVRASALVGMTLTPHGLVHAAPMDVMQYRARIGAGCIRVFADVSSMHFSWLGGGAGPEDVARGAKLVGADAVVVAHRDESRVLAMVAAVRAAVPDMPIILGGYTNHQNAARLLAVADGAFVGTCLEKGGWGGKVDVDRVRAYMELVRGLGPSER